MPYRENEILNELLVGQIYTERQIRGLLAFTQNVFVLSNDRSHFEEKEGRKYIVEDKKKTFVHQHSNGNHLYTFVKFAVYKVRLI